MEKIKSPEEILDFVRERYTDNILSSEIREKTEGLSGVKLEDIWITVKKDIFKDLVKTLHKEIDFLHISVISPVDMGETIEIVYHFAVYYGKEGKECIINVKIILPKNESLTIPTITDILPGALFSELDLKHMMGIDVIGLEDEGPLFLPDEFPKDFYPWRKDEKSIDNYMKDFTINSEGNRDGNL